MGFDVNVIRQAQSRDPEASTAHFFPSGGERSPGETGRVSWRNFSAKMSGSQGEPLAMACLRLRSMYSTRSLPRFATSAMRLPVVGMRLSMTLFPLRLYVYHSNSRLVNDCITYKAA